MDRERELGAVGFTERLPVKKPLSACDCCWKASDPTAWPPADAAGATARGCDLRVGDGDQDAAADVAHEIDEAGNLVAFLLGHARRRRRW